MKPLNFFNPKIFEDRHSDVIIVIIYFLADPAKEACDSADKMILFNNINIRQNNIGGLRPIYDREKCAEECFKTQNCKAFTWVPSSHSGKAAG